MNKPIDPFRKAQSMIALFILWGKNQVATLVEASVNTFSERFDIGINETLAISAVNKKINQKTNLAFPPGLGNLLGMGFLIFLNIGIYIHIVPR